MFKLTGSVLAFSLVSFSAYAGISVPITSCYKLQNIAKDLSAHYYLTTDLDCYGAGFEPIQGVFTGSLSGKDTDGKIHSIKNIRIEAKPGKNGGLFDTIEGATVSDIRFDNIAVYSEDNTSRGLIAGRMSNATLVNISANNIEVRGETTSDSLSPWSKFGVAGGIAGFAGDSVFKSIHLTNVYVKQHMYAGGFVGDAYNLRIEKSSVKNLSEIWEWQRTEPFPEGMSFGGLIGKAGAAQIIQSSATGDIASPWEAGGLIGAAAWGVTIENSYSQVNVWSNHFAGGIIGRSYSTVNLKHVFATGHVDGDYGRGMIGSMKQHGDEPSNITEGYFDKDTTKREYSGDDGSKARSTKRMTKEHQRTFDVDKGWSREVWVFYTGEYPRLKM